MQEQCKIFLYDVFKFNKFCNFATDTKSVGDMNEFLLDIFNKISYIIRDNASDVKDNKYSVSIKTDTQSSSLYNKELEKVSNRYELTLKEMKKYIEYFTFLSKLEARQKECFYYNVDGYNKKLYAEQESNKDGKIAGSYDK